MKTIGKNIQTAIPAIIFIFACWAPIKGQNPFIPKYDAVKRSERCFTVTWEANNQFGAVWWADKVDFSQDTSFNFVVYMGDRDGNGADGLAFVMHQDPRDTITDTSQQVDIGGAGTWDLEAATGDDGGGLGFAMHQSRVGPNTIPGPHGPGDDAENHKIQSSVAVEIDTWNNNDVPDGDNGTDANGVNHATSPYFGWDHTAVIYNGDLYGGQQIITDANGNSGRILPLKPDYAFGSGNNPNGSPHHNIEDDRCYLFQIRWVVNADGTQDLSLWADVYNGTTDTDGLQMIMTHNDDMINNVFGGNSVMRFGFTGSTGGSINEQTVCLLGENLKPFAENDFASIPMNTTAIIDVEANDNDPDGDQLHVPIIIDPASNGSASIFDSLGTNYVRYVPNTNFVGLDTIGYVTCDVNSTKCYAKCDTAFVFIDVGCVPFDVDVSALSPNTTCDISSPANGAAEAQVTSGSIFGIHWSEDFNDISNGTQSDTGNTAWEMDDSNACYDNPQDRAEVEGQRMWISDIGDHGSGCEVVWSSEVIDISSLTNVSITVDASASGNMETSYDYLRIYYRLDGSPEIALANGLLAGSFGTAKASVAGLNGNDLQIVIRATNSANNEIYYFDNIIVSAIGAGTANVDYNWYEGADTSGAPDYTGQIYNGMQSGLYTVIAQDLNTGCLSNPQTVTIDSAFTRPVGGYINQVSPFTNCTMPYDGQLEAGVFDGTDSTIVGYDFQWYIQEDPTNIIQSGYLASGLRAREYTVQIIDQSTGCDTTLSAEVINAVSIPAVNATKIADITSCTNPNSGIGEANVGGMTTGYTFEWYAGPSIVAGPPDFTGSTINTFPVGTFTVQAIDSVTSCPSDAVTITVVDLTADPIVLVSVDSEQLSCDTLSPTGQLSGAVDISGTPTTAGYSFNWYKGANDVIPARPGYTGGPIADSLEAGNYRLVVIEDGTNCTAFVDTLISEVTVPIPNITLSAVNVTHCALPNGSITVNVVGNPADYFYEVYNGNGVVADSLLLTSSSNIIQNLDIGNYTIVAKDNISRCASAPAYATISDATALPLVTISSQDQISCDTSNFTGRLTASVSMGSITDYSFEWFEDDLSGTLLTSSSPNGEIVSNLDSGGYALRITNNSSQCSNTFYAAVNTAIIFPVESVASIPSTFCDVNGNGQLIATVDGGLTEADGYTFIWERAASSDTLTSTTATVTQVAPGDYILTVINNATSCASNPAPITVGNNTVIPLPDLSVSDNSSCDIANPNGEIIVTGISNEVDPLNNYQYLWYEDSISGPQLGTPGISFPSAPDSMHIGSLDAGTIALHITNKTTQCSNVVLSIINNINIKPIIDVVTTDDAENCVSPFNSGASVLTVNGGSPIPAGFTFEWLNLDGGPAIVNTASNISDIDMSDDVLPPGNYQVTAFNQYGCPSDPVTFELLDNSVPPVFSLTGYNNISCDPALPVGSLVALRPNETVTISTFEWFENNVNGNLLATTTTVDSILLDLPGNTYAVRITDSATGCTSIEYATIQDAPSSNPAIENTINNGLTSCITPNGELGYRVIPFENEPPFSANPRSYTFYLNGASSYNQTTSGTDNVTFNGLTAGTWDAYVVDEFSHCQSDPVTTDMANAPNIIITSDAIQLPSSCIGTDGILKVFAETPTNDSISGGAGFSFTWFRGVNADKGSVSATTSSNNFWSIASGLTSDYYFVLIEDLATGCTKDSTIFLESSSVPVIVNANATPSNRCDPFGNGGVTFEMNNFPVGRGYPDYDFRIYEGSNFDPDNLAQNLVEVISGPLGGPVNFTSNLAPGNYTIVAQENFPANCLSQPVVVNVGLDFNFPVINASIIPDKSCLGAANGTGQLEVINTTPAYALGDFQFDWFSGTTSIASGTTTPATFMAGNYNLIAEITANIPGQGCSTDTLLIVPKVLENIEIVAFATPNNNCAPFEDGSINISDIMENSVSIGALAGDYVNFNLFDNGLNLLASNNTAAPWMALSAGNYYVQAQNDITKCYTNIEQITVDDLAADPIINLALNSPDYACDPTLASGELEASVNEGGGSFNQNAADYEFNWYRGDLSGSFLFNNFMASNLSANTSTQLYTVEVIDIAGSNQGCSSSKGYTLTHQPTSVYVLKQEIGITDQTNCIPNGSIEIETISKDDPNLGTISTSAPYAGLYDVQLLKHNLQPSTAAYGNFNQLSGFFEDGSGNTSVIPAGIYYVLPQDLTTGCSYGPFTQVIIRNESKNPIVTAILDNPDYSCTGGTGTGILTPTVLGGSDNDNYPNFDINWYFSDTMVPPNTDNGGGAYEDRAIDLVAGTYTIEVTDISGNDFNCVTRRDFIVPAARQDIDLFLSGTEQTICIPDGTVQIDSILVNNTIVSNPHLTWTSQLLDASRNPVIPAPAGTGFDSNNDPYTNLAAGLYFVQVQENLTQCYSAPHQINVADSTKYPEIDINIVSPQYSLNPNPASWTGSMTASVVEFDGLPAPGGYNYSWHQGQGTSSPSISALDSIGMLDQATYTFTADNIATGCQSTYQVYLPYVYLEPTINTTTIPKTVCAPVDGGITINDIRLDGNPDQLSDFTFSIYHDSYTAGDVPDQIIPGDDLGTSYSNINSGSYYIVARENWWWIESAPVKVEVMDSTTNPIVSFDVSNYQAVTSCDQNVITNGALAITVAEDSSNPYLNPPFNYSYAWYTGNEVNPANLITDSISNSISNMPSGAYAVLVTNLGNLCETNAHYIIEDNSVTPVAIPSMSPITNCPAEMANGVVTAKVLNSNQSFDYLWYTGTDVGPAPEYIGESWEDRSPGYYTVVAIDQEFGTCISESVFIEVEEATILPEIVLSEIHPITNCDPAKANAVISATTNEGLVGYTFEWFTDNQLFFSGPLVRDLGNAIYEVQVTNDLTQCSSTKEAIPTVLYDVIPKPDVTILSERTSCNEPDGQAKATVEGNAKDYIFKYYRKDDNSSVDNLFVDNVIYDLDTTTYLVLAESRISGCVSDPTEFAISNETYYPEIDVIADPSDCQDPNGAANVIVSDLTKDFKVTWKGDNGFEAQEKEIVYIPIGTYTVEVEGTDGCISTAEAEVKGDVIIYNGVSANYDGANDFFAIVCLEYFPDNNVKIFNRAGLLVYEQNAYDMNDPAKRFEGFSNKGASIIGTELPIGTYFYVVDKNDGSKAKVGYLELNR